jgi:lysozyme
MSPITEILNKRGIGLIGKALSLSKHFLAPLTLLLALDLCSTTASAKSSSAVSVMAEDLAFYQQQVQNPSVQKLLNAIRYAEGTAGPQGYQTQFSGKKFSDLSRHPDQAISSGGYTSTAAGAYQFLTPTWQSVAKKLGLKGFGPKEQDIAGTYLAHQRLKPIGGFARLEKEGLSPEVAAALSPEWASFPTQSGKSYYGQPVKSLKELQKVFGTTPKTTQPTQQLTQQPVAARQAQTPGGITYNIYLTDEDQRESVDPTDFMRTLALGRRSNLSVADMASAIAGAASAPQNFGFGMS